MTPTEAQRLADLLQQAHDDARTRGLPKSIQQRFIDATDVINQIVTPDA